MGPRFFYVHGKLQSRTGNADVALAPVPARCRRIGSPSPRVTTSG